MAGRTGRGLRSLCLSRRRARRRPPARARRARALDRPLDRRQSARLSPARSRARRSGRGCPKRERWPSSRPRPPSATARRPRCVVAGPGSQALIQALARLAPHGAVGRLGPTYGGHAEAFARGRALAWSSGLPSTTSPAATSRSSSIPTIPTAGSHAAPTFSTCTSGSTGAAAAHRRRGFRRFRRRGESLRRSCRRRGAVVLRSFGKSYGLAGAAARLRHRLAGHRDRLRAALGPWPVSGPAIAIGARALADLDWTRGHGARASARKRRGSTRCCRSCGWRIVGGTRLFRLAAKADARHGVSTACSRAGF